jgi:hypothetical protein
LPVHAQGRASALDQRVDAISTQQLLTSPAPALVDPDRQVAAVRYINARIPGFLLVYLLAIGALVYFWRSGLASAHRDRLRRKFRTEFAARWFFGAGLAVIAWLASLLPQFYLYRLDRVMGLSQESWTAWILGWFLSAGVACIVVGTIAAIVLWLSDKTHQWYLYTAAGVVAVTILYAYIVPPAVDPLRTALVESLIIIVSMALAVTIADRVGFRRDDDPVSRLALVAALLGGVYLIALPVYLSYVRGTVVRADIAAVTASGDRASAVRGMVRRADQDLEPVCPNAFATLYFAQTPAIGSRISAFNGTPDPCR